MTMQMKYLVEKKLLENKFSVKNEYTVIDKLKEYMKQKKKYYLIYQICTVTYE